MFSKPVPKILIVDDEASVRDFLARAVTAVARQVTTASDAYEALDLLEGQDYDLIICDMAMAGCTGMELLATARRAFWDVGFIMISGSASPDTVISALRLQASDFLVKPFTVNQLRDSVVCSYGQLLAQREARAYHGMLETSLARRTRDLENALRMVESNYDATLEALVAALDAREHETFNHSFRVRAYASHLARIVGYPPAFFAQLEQGALLHDIGKIAVSDAILLKPGKLTLEEWVEMKKHPVMGENILNHVPFLAPAAVIVRHHHERYDGGGYPDGLAGEQIPLGARIFAFADTLDAMTSDRPYRQAPGFAAAQKEIERCKGSQFDPNIADIFLRVQVEQWLELRRAAEGTPASLFASPVEDPVGAPVLV